MLVDGAVVQTITELSTPSSTYISWEVDVTPYADGAVHNVAFRYTGTTNGFSNFTVDDVDLYSCPLPAPSITVSPSTWMAPVDGGTQSITVAANRTDAAWSAVSSAPWVSVAPLNGVGSGSVSLTASSNAASTLQRAAVVTVGGRSILVTQPGAAATYSLSSTSMSVGGDGAVSRVLLTASHADASWTAVSNRSWLTVSPAAGSGSQLLTITADPNQGVLSRSGTLTVAGSTIVVNQDAAPTYDSYLAEGATGTFFDTQLALLNPGTTTATIAIGYFRSGAAPITQTMTLAAGTRATLWPRQVPGLESAEFSTQVRSTVPLVVDRTMSWGGGYGSHAETATANPSRTWYLAEGATHSGFSLFYLLQNPGNTATTARVRYLRGSGPPLEKVYLLPALSRTNIWVNVEEFPGLGRALAAEEVSAVIETQDGTPIIVERAMYRSNQGRTFNAGHESMGVTTPAIRWFLAEGNTGPFFDQFVLIANPSDTAADVRVTYLLANGTTYAKTMTAPANSRSGIWVDYDTIPGVPGYPLENVALSTTVESTNGVGLVVERAMWWPGDGNTWHEAHNSSGAIETGIAWALAEGEVGGLRNTQTYVLVANTSSYAGRAKVTLCFENGQKLEKIYPLLPQSRMNAAIGPDFGTQVEGKRFGVIVEALGATEGATVPQIVVERAMYSDAEGVPLAAGTNAIATRLR
ncbi:BACON domain-containing protein [Luteitalea sp. TBR-22]|uniref:BACON domain-containing protein n=1 Tax=Luteitalea sp. TBR-22 TaxID=2802971 RepID=UPI001EF50CD6|nr:BACON domain-containing protein [Luteitalea sp. TBR-22]